MTEELVSLTQIELERVPQSLVYLCAESFGSCLALKVLEKFPQLFTKVILINSASSFHRVSLLNLGSLLFPYTPQFFYKISSFLCLPFLVNLSRISSTASLALLKSTRSAPKETANQRLSLMREFNIDENKLSQITQPVLLIASRDDRLLPSEAEAQRLSNIFPNSQIITLPNSGHACLVQNDVDIYQILLLRNEFRISSGEQIKPFTWLTTPNKYLILINGGTHFSTIAESPNASIPVPTEAIGPSPALARRYVEDLSVPFFETYIAQQPSYLPYLSKDYVNQISQQPLSLSLIKSLTSEELKKVF